MSVILAGAWVEPWSDLLELLPGSSSLSSLSTT